MSYNLSYTNSHSKYAHSCYTNTGRINNIITGIIIYSASVGVTRMNVLAMRIIGSIHYPTKNLNILISHIHIWYPPPIVGAHEVSSLHLWDWLDEVFPLVREENRSSFLIEPQQFLPAWITATGTCTSE